jgi:plasmid stabilization system protein ParE
VAWTRGAQQDARNLVLGLHEHSPASARALAEEFALAAERLSDFPRLGIEVGDRGHRYLLVAHGRYRLICRLDGDTLRILGLSRSGRS